MRITFRYKLEGFDSDWVEAGSRREAFYTNLSPGQYQFRVAARNVDENYWEAAQPVTFTIRPYFYQTFWFLPSCVVALCLVGLGAYRCACAGSRNRCVPWWPSVVVLPANCMTR